MAKIGNLVPLIILMIVLGVGAFIGFSIYTWSNELAERGKKKMEKKNMSFTKEGGLRVGVKEVKDEKYADTTQNVLVNVWNNASLPNYKSRLGWNSTQAHQQQEAQADAKKHKSNKSAAASSAPRPSSSRTSSSAAAASLSPPAQRPAAARRTPSTPGGWD